MHTIRTITRAMRAITNKDDATLFTLLDTGLPVDSANNFGISLLHIAAECASTATVAALLGRGTNVNALSGYGLTPLMMAARAGNLKTVTLLAGIWRGLDTARVRGN